MNARIETLTAEHVAMLAPRARLYDEARVRASCGFGAAEMLEAGLRTSVHAWCGFVDELPICAFGLNARSLLSSEAIPWLIVTPEVQRYRRIFWRHSREVVAMMLERYPRLVTHCQANFEASRRWLMRLGFVETRNDFHAFGVDFLTLRLERN